MKSRSKRSKKRYVRYRALWVEIGSLLRRAFTVVAVDQDGAALRGGAGIDIAPAVANQEAAMHVDAVAARGIQ